MLTNEQIDRLYGATVGFMADVPHTDLDGHRIFIRAVEGAILAQNEEEADLSTPDAEAFTAATNLTRTVVPMLLKRSGYHPIRTGKMAADFFQEILRGIKAISEIEKEPEDADQPANCRFVWQCGGFSRRRSPSDRDHIALLPVRWKTPFSRN